MSLSTKLLLLYTGFIGVILCPAIKVVIPVIPLLMPGMEALMLEVTASVLCIASCVGLSYSSCVEIALQC